MTMPGLLLQTGAGVQFPTSIGLGVVLVAFIAGLAVPARYGLERLNGFSRWFASRIPYRPPPGQDAEQAMREATGGDSPGDPEQPEDAASDGRSGDQPRDDKGRFRPKSDGGG